MRNILIRTGLTGLVFLFLVLNSSLKNNCENCRFEEIYSGDSARGFCGLTIDRVSGSYAFNEFYFDHRSELRYNTRIVSPQTSGELIIESQLLCLLEVDSSIVMYDSSHIYRLSRDGKILNSCEMIVRNPYKAKSSGGVLYFNDTRDQIIAVNVVSMKTDTLLNKEDVFNLITPRPSACKIEDFDVQSGVLYAIVSVKSLDQMTTFLIKGDINTNEISYVVRKIKNQKNEATYYKSPLIALNRRGTPFFVAERNDSCSVLYYLNRKYEVREVYNIPVGIEIEQFFIAEKGQALFCGFDKKRRTFNYGVQPIKNYFRILYSWVSIYRLNLNECK